MAVRLYCFELSHPSQAAKVMLETKGIAYEESVLPAGLHSALLRLRGFEKPTAPALKLDAGRRTQGTLAISRLLDELVGAPPLHPTPEVTDAERWGELELQ